MINLKSNLCFPKESRLAKAKEFNLVYQKNNVRIGGRYFLILAFSTFNNDGNNSARIGVVASKKVSKKAVIRNKIKRIIRERFRHSDVVDNFNYVVIAKIGASKIDNDKLNSELCYLWNKINKKCNSYL